MNNIIVNNDQGFGCLLWITCPMKIFVENFKLNHCEISVSVVPAGYYASKEEYDGGAFVSPLGFYVNKTPFDERDLTLKYCFKLLPITESFINKLNNFAKDIDVTLGGTKQRLCLLKIEPVYRYERKNNFTYICKKSYFDWHLDL